MMGRGCFRATSFLKNQPRCRQEHSDQGFHVSRPCSIQHKRHTDTTSTNRFMKPLYGSKNNFIPHHMGSFQSSSSLIKSEFLSSNWLFCTSYRGEQIAVCKFYFCWAILQSKAPQGTGALLSALFFMSPTHSCTRNITYPRIM